MGPVRLRTYKVDRTAALPSVLTLTGEQSHVMTTNEHDFGVCRLDSTYQEPEAWEGSLLFPNGDILAEEWA